MLLLFESNLWHSGERSEKISYKYSLDVFEAETI